MTTTTIEVRSINRPSSITDAVDCRKDSPQRPWTNDELEAKRAKLLAAVLSEVITSFSASSDEAFDALITALDTRPKAVEVLCRDCGATFHRRPGNISARRCPGCSDSRRNEMSAETARRRKANRPPPLPRVRVNGAFVSREQPESPTTHTKRAVTGEPCPACGRQPPTSRGNRFCSRECYRKAMKGARYGSREPVQNRTGTTG